MYGMPLDHWKHERAREPYIFTWFIYVSVYVEPIEWQIDFTDNEKI